MKVLSGSYHRTQDKRSFGVVVTADGKKIICLLGCRPRWCFSSGSRCERHAVGTTLCMIKLTVASAVLWHVPGYYIKLEVHSVEHGDCQVHNDL